MQLRFFQPVLLHTMQSLLLLLLPLLLSLLFLLKTRPNGKRPLLPPGPPGLPFIGYLHKLGSTAPHLSFAQLSNRYGPLMSLRLGSRHLVVISSARVAKEAFKTNDLALSGRPPLISWQRLSYNGSDLAFAPYGEYWREMRKLCVLQLLSPKRVQSFHSIREDEISCLIEKISKSAAASKLVNLSEMLMSLTNSVVCRIAFGKKYDGEEGCERSRFHGLLNEAQAMIGSFFVSDYVPWLGWVDRVSALLGRLDKNFRDMDLFYEDIINHHLDPSRPQPENEDIVDVMLRLRRDQLFMSDLTFDQIKGVLMNIFVAGTDTSAATVTWVMMELMKNPEVMKKAQEEVRSLIGKKDSINEEELHKLPYLKAVVKETLRLHPVAPLLVPRETIQKCMIDGYEIPPESVVYVNAWAIGRDPDSWENPEHFFPERFMDSSIDFNGLDFELIPFGVGRRGCPGIHLGAVIVELALANILYSFDWELPYGMKKDDIDDDVLPGITMHKKTPLCLLARTP